MDSVRSANALLAGFIAAVLLLAPRTFGARCSFVAREESRSALLLLLSLLLACLLACSLHSVSATIRCTCTVFRHGVHSCTSRRYHWLCGSAATVAAAAAPLLHTSTHTSCLPQSRTPTGPPPTPPRSQPILSPATRTTVYPSNFVLAPRTESQRLSHCIAFCFGNSCCSCCFASEHTQQAP